MTPEERRLLEALPLHPGHCATCKHLRLLASKRSVFARCGLADVDPAFVRYPPLPVRLCSGFRPRLEGAVSTLDPGKDS